MLPWRSTSKLCSPARRAAFQQHSQRWGWGQVHWHPRRSCSETKTKGCCVSSTAPRVFQLRAPTACSRCSRPAFAQMEDVPRNAPVAIVPPGGCIPAWCQRDMSHYLPNLCLHCILQVSVTPGLYPAARVSICINLSQQTSLFCRGNKLSVQKMQLR